MALRITFQRFPDFLYLRHKGPGELRIRPATVKGRWDEIPRSSARLDLDVVKLLREDRDRR